MYNYPIHRVDLEVGFSRVSNFYKIRPDFQRKASNFRFTDHRKRGGKSGARFVVQSGASLSLMSSDLFFLGEVGV